MKRRMSSQAFGGLVLIGIGALFLARQLGYTNFSIGELFANFWPVALILWGVAGALDRRHGSGSSFGALIGIAIGVFFLGNNLEWFDISFGDFIKMLIPAALILGGLTVIARPRRSEPPVPPTPPVPPGRPPFRPEAPAEADIPPAAPLESTLDEEFERKFGKPAGLGEVPPQGTTAGGPSPGAEDARKSFASSPQPEEDEDEAYGDSRYDGDWREAERDERESGRDRRREERHERHMERRREQAERHRRHWEERAQRRGGGHSFHDDEHSTNRSAFVGDIHMGREHFRLKHTNISQFIGDTVLDLTNAQIPYGETKINISAFIGDLKIYIPDDMDLGISVNSSSFIGDMEVLEQSRSGFMSSLQFKTPYYKESGRRLKINISAFIGDIKVKTVG